MRRARSTSSPASSQSGAGTCSGEALISCRQRTSGASRSTSCEHLRLRARGSRSRSRWRSEHSEACSKPLWRRAQTRKAEPRRVPPPGAASARGGVCRRRRHCDVTSAPRIQHPPRRLSLRLRPAVRRAGLPPRGRPRPARPALRRWPCRPARPSCAKPASASRWRSSPPRRRCRQGVADRLHLRFQVAPGLGRDLVAQVLQRLLGRRTRGCRAGCGARSPRARCLSSASCAWASFTALSMSSLTGRRWR